MIGLKYILNFLKHPYYSVFSKILLCGVLLLIITIVNPTRSYSKLPPIDPRDTYIRTKLKFKVKYQYGSQKSRSNGVDGPSSWVFTEAYGLKLSGNLIDPRLIIYDTYANYTISHRSSNRNSASHLNLGISSTIFRKFRYPITVYENRSFGKDTITDSFGARSHLRL